MMKNLIFVSAIFFISLISFGEQKLPQLFIDAETNHLKNIRDIAISINGQICFTHQDPDMKFSVIYFVQPNGTPRKAPFSGKYLDMEPFFKPHSSFLYFVSDRPHIYNTEPFRNFDIWCVELAYPPDSLVPIHPEASYNTSANEF